MNEPARFVVPPLLLAQLRAHRSQQRARRLERAPAPKASLIETIKGLIDSPCPDVTRAATSFVDQMDSLQREVEDAEDAFLLDPGLGPMLYLTSDGRILEDHRTWDGEGLREAVLDDAIAALVAGAKKTGITDLLRLVPECPDDGSRCPRCDGERRQQLREHGVKIICGLCCGRGWVTPELLEAEKARGVAG